jgi:hypothetical protein
MLTNIPYRTMLRSGIQTVLCLFGGPSVGSLLASMTFNALPGHSNANLRITLTMIPVIAGLLIGSALWGVQMGRLIQVAEDRRMAVVGVLGFAPITLGLGILLNVLEPVAVQQFGRQIPIHRLFTLLFVPAVFISAGVSAWAIGVGLRNMTLARSLSWRVGLAAALAFLIVNLVMEGLGWIVGAPRAAERLTMLTVVFAGNLGGALLGGAVLGWVLKATPVRPAP